MILIFILITRRNFHGFLLVLEQARLRRYLEKDFEFFYFYFNELQAIFLKNFIKISILRKYLRLH